MSEQVDLAEGQTYIEGRSEATARELLEAAGDRGAEVLTTSFGYIVPSDLVSDADEDKGTEFDPAEAKVEEVLEYLAGADEDERKRVLDAEVAGKNRVTITAAEGAK